MKRIFLFFALLLACTPALQAQNIRKRYTSLTTENGSLYFIFPRKLAATGDTDGEKNLPLDLTYLTSNDSIFFTVSLRIPGNRSVDSVRIEAVSGEQASATPERIYIDARRSGYEHRLRFGIPFRQARRLYDEASPYVLRFVMADGTYSYAFPAKVWKKERAVISRIFEVFEINR